LMTWSINWDAAGGFSLSSNVGAFLHSLANGGGQKPMITAATADGKSLVVTGSGFDSGAVITVNQQDQPTINDDASPTTKLIGKRMISGAGMGPGVTFSVQVRDPSGVLSNIPQTTRP